MKILTIILQRLSSCIDAAKVGTIEDVGSHGSDFQNEGEQHIRLEYLKVVATIKFRI